MPHALPTPAITEPNTLHSILLYTVKAYRMECFTSLHSHSLPCFVQWLSVPDPEAGRLLTVNKSFLSTLSTPAHKHAMPRPRLLSPVKLPAISSLSSIVGSPRHHALPSSGHLSSTGGARSPIGYNLRATVLLRKLLSKLQTAIRFLLSSSFRSSTSEFSNMPEQDGMKCCKCFWVHPRAVHVTCTECQHIFCTECELVFLREGKGQPIPDVNIDMNASSTRALSGGDPNHTQSPTNHPSIHFALGMASEGSPPLAPSSAPLQTGPALPEQTVPAPEYSASGPDDKPVDGEWLWSCHNCGHGPWLYVHTPACLNCGHVRCSGCSFEER